MEQENINQTPAPQMEPKSKRKIIIIVLGCFLIAGIAAAMFIPTSEESLRNKKEERRQQKLNQTEESDSSEAVSGENNGSTYGDTIGSAVLGLVSYNEDYTVTTKKDVVYGTGSGMNLKIDIYTPNGVSGATPVVLYIHGGGFHGGSKNGVADDAEMLAKHGVAVVGIDYRLSGTAIFPAPLNDVKGVARYMKAHATEYNIDPNAFFTLGESAGGVLASLMGVTEGNTTLEGTVGGNTGYDSNIAGVINISGSYVASIVDTMSGGIKNAISAETGCDPVPSTACEDEYKALSAETYISAGDSPFIILHGAKDQSVPQIQAETLDDKLENAGIASEVYIASDLAHVGGLLARYLDEVISFINTNS